MKNYTCSICWVFIIHFHTKLHRKFWVFISHYYYNPLSIMHVYLLQQLPICWGVRLDVCSLKFHTKALYKFTSLAGSVFQKLIPTVFPNFMYSPTNAGTHSMQYYFNRLPACQSVWQGRHPCYTMSFDQVIGGEARWEAEPHTPPSGACSHHPQTL